jgi:uncharacterized membrane protein YgcG
MIAAVENEIKIEEAAPEIQIENKSSQFSAVLQDSGISASDDDSMAKSIREQRRKLEVSEALEYSTSIGAASGAASSCNVSLRKCVSEKCGGDEFKNCALDSDTIWGEKINSCRRNVSCTAEEFTGYSREIKLDRDAGANLAGYFEVVNCGNRYNNCIVAECGANLIKCAGKAAGDVAVQKCASIAKECQTADSGLAGRATGVFGTLRGVVEKDLASDEKQLAALRDKLAANCKRFGAAFDERSFSCVYTVEFFMGDGEHPMASKKLYAGDTFTCNQDFFGIDATTYKENASRLTRSQTGASSALLGAGLGTAVGAVTSGAVGRAIDTKKAENAAEKAECKEGEKCNAALSKCVGGGAKTSSDTSSSEDAPAVAPLLEAKTDRELADQAKKEFEAGQGAEIKDLKKSEKDGQQYNWKSPPKVPGQEEKNVPPSSNANSLYSVPMAASEKPSGEQPRVNVVSNRNADGSLKSSSGSGGASGTGSSGSSSSGSSSGSNGVSSSSGGGSAGS